MPYLAFRPTLAAMLAAVVVLTPAYAANEDLGHIDFPNSGAPQAQETFLRGVLLLHSFEFEDAREAFQAAQEIDPEFALAYWGEAMTHNHPLWRQQDRDAALAALARYAPTPEERLAKAPTEREAAYLAAVDRLYGEGDKTERDRAYCEAMSELAERYPEDLEARAFYALSILGTTDGERDFRVYMRAAAVAEEVFAADPLHPGATHYLIHSYDDPIHAPLGLRAARVYAKIAPAASHAQHMISHIYVALGRWADSVDSNVRAFEVSEQRRERKNLGVDQLNYHALHWLEYSYLQLGRRAEARETLDRMLAYARESGSSRALWYFSAMRATWNVETLGENPPPHLDYGDLDLDGAAQDLFAEGLLAARSGNLAVAQERLDTLSERLSTAESEGARASLLDTARVLELELTASIADRRGDRDGAIEALREATAIEAAKPLDYGPPDIVKPSHELFGEMLLAMGQPSEAAAQFRIALDRAPRRTLSLSGLATAAARTGDAETLTRACDELREILTAAPTPLPAACAGSETQAPASRAHAQTSLFRPARQIR